MSEKTLHEKLVEISKEIGFVEFDKTNSGMGYKYASAAGMIRKLNKALTEHGLVASVEREDIQYHPADGVAISNLVLKVTDGRTAIYTCGCGSGKDKGDKAVMKASTAAFKYAIAHLFMLGWGAEDPEADESTDQEKPAKKKPGRPPKAKKEEPEAAGPIDVEALKEMIKAMTTENQSDVRDLIVGQKDILPKGVYDALADAWRGKKDSLRTAA